MKTSIETINGKLYTVIWHVQASSESILGRRFVTLHNGSLGIFAEADCLNLMATALPALKRIPTQEDIKLYLRYESEGLEIYMKDAILGECRWLNYQEVLINKDSSILYAEDNKGNRVEIAIKD